MSGLSLMITPQEQKLFDEFCEFKAKRNVDVTLRVAGGWVRDKLLGRPTGDIDIALDTMTGSAFMSQFSHWCPHPGRLKCKILPRHPEKSRYLEVARLTRHGQKVDILHLRSAIYTDASKPITIGTPYDDAMGRDFTCNALFYNLSTKEIEDFTEKGLSDLKARLIRTPRRAEETFMDDPIRAVRAVRLASILDFDIDAEVLVASKNPAILVGLREKASKEQLTAEVQKILRQAPVEAGLSLLFNSTPLGDVIFGSKKDFRQLKRGEMSVSRFVLKPVSALFALLRKSLESAPLKLKSGCLGVRASDFETRGPHSSAPRNKLLAMAVLATLFYHQVPELHKGPSSARWQRQFAQSCIKLDRAQANLLRQLIRGASLISKACATIPSDASEDQFAAFLNVPDELLEPRVVVSELQQKLALIVSGVGKHWRWAALVAKALHPRRERSIEIFCRLAIADQ